jgi:hypothetical protein
MDELQQPPQQDMQQGHDELNNHQQERHGYAHQNRSGEQSNQLIGGSLTVENITEQSRSYAIENNYLCVKYKVNNHFILSNFLHASKQEIINQLNSESNNIRRRLQTRDCGVPARSLSELCLCVEKVLRSGFHCLFFLCCQDL